MDQSIIHEILTIRRKFRDDHISKEVLKKHHAGFAEDFEHTFDMVCSWTCDDSMLNELINQANKDAS